MMGFAGSDTGRLRGLAGEADQMLAVIREVKQVLGQLQAELPGVWIGDDADRFLAQLRDVHLVAVNRVEARLADATAAMRRNAQMQDETSARLD